jgi:uncharacterized protein (TIGR00255 family)
MIRSMTGYASEIRNTDKYDVSMEIKSVNSRYFEFRLKTYSSIDEWENEIKNIVAEKLKRGKIDLFVKIVEKDAKNVKVVVNFDLAKKYEEALVSLSKNIGIAPNLTMKDFVTLGNILQVERVEGDEDLYELLISMLHALIKKALEMMHIEGEKTKDDVLNSIETIQKSVTAVEGVYPETLEKYKKQLKERIAEVYPDSGEPLANGRLIMEVELVASRTAINEELVRLKSHMNQFRNILAGKAGGDSKKLDFIGQEMNRETNTIASKSSDYGIIEHTIVIKGEIEKIREQLRNLE